MNIVAYFSVPEMKGRSLEEIDALFEMKVPLRKFGDTVLPKSDAGAMDRTSDEERGGSAPGSKKEFSLV